MKCTRLQTSLQVVVGGYAEGSLGDTKLFYIKRPTAYVFSFPFLFVLQVI